MIIGLVGESGSGKTTIARLIALFYPLTDGSIELEGTPAPADKGHRADAYRAQVQLMFQDPFGSLNVVHTVGYTLGRVLTLHGFKGSKAQRRDRIVELLQQVRLEPAADYLDRYPYELSGGQRQRVVLARALAVEPKIILADEPVSMLDVSIRAEMLNLFADLRDRTGLSLLYVTHDMAGARYLCDEIAVMYAGQIVEYGPAEQVVVSPAHPYTRLLIESSPDPTRAETISRDERFGSSRDVGEPPNVIDPEPGCRFAARCPYADKTCHTVDPPQIRTPGGQLTRCWLYDPSRAADAAIITTTLEREPLMTILARGWKRIGLVAVLGAALVVSACSATKKVEGSAGSTLNISYGATSFTNNFNFLSPTNTAVPPGSDLVYEPLIKLSPSTGFTPEPWLASSWAWSDAGKTLTFKLRTDVKWSDGTAFTSKDVAFTLGLLKNPHLVLGNPGPITSVATPDNATVVVHYSAASYAGFGKYYSVKILPQHIWATQDPTQYTASNPIGTGPFTMTSFGVQQVTYTLRSDYWGGTGKGVKTVKYQAARHPGHHRTEPDRRHLRLRPRVP